MPLVSSSFDLHSVEWRRVTDPHSKGFTVDFEYSLLGYDYATNRLDMLLRYGVGGHCRRHRHVASTVTLVLEGEQFLEEMFVDGRTNHIRRTKGTYALAQADALPHDEHGGPGGGTVLLSMSAAEDGILFEYFDENMQNPWTVTIQEYVESWENGIAYGQGPVLDEPSAPLESLAPENNQKYRAQEHASLEPMTSEVSHLGPRESQEVSMEDRVYDLSQAVPKDKESSRYAEREQRETKRNWKIGTGFAALIILMLFVAGYFIIGAYNRTLPASDRNLGDLTRPSLR